MTVKTPTRTVTPHKHYPGVAPVDVDYPGAAPLGGDYPRAAPLGEDNTSVDPHGPYRQGGATVSDADSDTEEEGEATGPVMVYNIFIKILWIFVKYWGVI